MVSVFQAPPLITHAAIHTCVRIHTFLHTCVHASSCISIVIVIIVIIIIIIIVIASSYTPYVYAPLQHRENARIMIRAGSLSQW